MTNPDEELVEYDPEPIALLDGEAVLFDQKEFCAEFNCHAVMFRDGALFVLCKESRKWVPAEGRGQEPSSPKGLRSVK